MRVAPKSPPRRSGLKACAIFIAPSSRSIIFSGSEQSSLTMTVKPARFVPLPGIVWIVVTPPVMAFSMEISSGFTHSAICSSGFIGVTISLNPPSVPICVCDSMMPGVTHLSDASMTLYPFGISIFACGPRASIFPSLRRMIPWFITTVSVPDFLAGAIVKIFPALMAYFGGAGLSSAYTEPAIMRMITEYIRIPFFMYPSCMQFCH